MDLGINGQGQGNPVPEKKGSREELQGDVVKNRGQEEKAKAHGIFVFIRMTETVAEQIGAEVFGVGLILFEGVAD